MNTTGFPSPAQGYEEARLDLNTLAIKHPSATFYMRYRGSPLPDYGIYYDDILIIDCSLKPAAGRLVVVRTIDGFKCHPIAGLRNYNGRKVFTYADSNGMEHICQEIFGVVRAALKLYTEN